MEVIDKHGVDAFRYYFLKHADTFLDADFTWEKFEAAYNNELANDLGNLVQRLATLAHKNQVSIKKEPQLEVAPEYAKLMDKFEFSKAFDFAWEKVQELNKRIDEEKPWSLAKNGETAKLEQCLTSLIIDLLKVNQMILPFMPKTSKRIKQIFAAGETRLPKSPLFPKN